MDEKVKKLLKYIEDKGLSTRQFEENADLSNGLIKKAKKLSLQSIEKILHVYPDLSDILIAPHHGSTQHNPYLNDYPKSKSLNELHEHPAVYVPANVQAGYMDKLGDPVFEKDLQRVILPSGYNDCDYVFQVDGDSMYPTFSTGDHVACKKVEKIKYLRPGEPYIIDYGEGLVLKRVFKSEIPDSLTLRSDNKGYHDYEIEQPDIKKIFHVKARLSKNTGEKRSYEDQILKMAKDIEILAKTLKKK